MLEGPAVRPPVAVLLSRFPLVTETFILREVAEMERQGQPVRLVPLLRERSATVHREAVPWVRDALFTPMLSAAIVAANARALRRDAGLYLRLLWRVLWGSRSSPNMLVRTLAIFPKSVYLAERLRAEGVAHVHAHFATHPALAALVVSTLAGIPYSVTVHAHDIFVRRAFLREKLAGASVVRTVSRFNRDFLASLHPELQGRLQVIHTGVDPLVYAHCAEPRAGAPPNILCVAALKPYKGLPVLVEACRRLRNEGIPFHCDIVGEGPGRRSLEAAILRARLQDQVRLRGARPQHEVARLLGEASLFVLPSVVAADGQMEGIPVALMEAMAASRPVIASALSGIPELVEDGASGLIVPPGDPERLSLAIRELLSDPVRARRMGEQGRRAVRERFRLDEVVRTLLDRIATPVTVDAGAAWAARLSTTQWPDGGHGPVGIRRVHDGRDSTAARLLVPNGSRPRDVVLKVHKDFAGQSAPPAERARREFEALCRLQGVFFGERGLGVPRPLGVAEDTVLMQACAGVALDDLARRTRWTGTRGERAALAATLRRTGAWLRTLQRATARESQAAGDAVDQLVARARVDLERAARQGLPPGAHLARRIDDAGREARAAARSLVGRHGDFWPGNVLVDRGRVRVIDFEGFGEGLPAEDVADFLVQLDLLHSYPGLGRMRAMLGAAFLDGYGRAGLDPSIYRLCRIAAALRALRRERTGAEGAAALWRRRMLRRLALES
jgi:glycosyltransferase involved in cell wall biosynthesis/aminoglycoside phosphotransferase (APT) family kinase protein